MRIDTFITLPVEAKVSIQWCYPASPRGKGGDTFITLYDNRLAGHRGIYGGKFSLFDHRQAAQSHA